MLLRIALAFSYFVFVYEVKPRLPYLHAENDCGRPSSPCRTFHNPVGTYFTSETVFSAAVFIPSGMDRYRSISRSVIPHTECLVNGDLYCIL